MSRTWEQSLSATGFSSRRPVGEFKYQSVRWVIAGREFVCSECAATIRKGIPYNRYAYSDEDTEIIQIMCIACVQKLYPKEITDMKGLALFHRKGTRTTPFGVGALSAIMQKCC